MSAASSGGICSNAWRTASTMRVTGSASASATIASVTVISFGTPEIVAALDRHRHALPVVGGLGGADFLLDALGG